VYFPLLPRGPRGGRGVMEWNVGGESLDWNARNVDN